MAPRRPALADKSSAAVASVPSASGHAPDECPNPCGCFAPCTELSWQVVLTALTALTVLTIAGRFSIPRLILMSVFRLALLD